MSEPNREDVAAAAAGDGAQVHLSDVNRLPADRVSELLSACCASPDWVNALLAARPFADLVGVLDASDKAVESLSEGQLDIALSGHPRIGDRLAPAASDASPGHTWSAREQSGVEDGDDDLMTALADGNRAYEERFGHVYLVCATGKSGRDMLTLLRQRMTNDPRREREVVREELGKINRIRLRRLLGAERADREPGTR